MKYFLSFDGAAPLNACGSVSGQSADLRYFMGDVRYSLRVYKNKLIHTTFGDGLSMELVAGEAATGTIRLGNRTADYPVFCERLDVDFCDGGFSVDVKFRPVTSCVAEACKKTSAAVGTETDVKSIPNGANACAKTTADVIDGSAKATCEDNTAPAEDATGDADNPIEVVAGDVYNPAEVIPEDNTAPAESDLISLRILATPSDKI